MTAAITKIALRVVLLTAALSLAVSAAALVGHGPGITFAWSGGWGSNHNSGSPFNLRIDNHATYNGVEVPGSSWALKDLVPTADHFFDFGDIKPGDRGEVTVSFHVNKDAWVCLDFENLEEADNGQNEPEGLEDPDGNAGAELADGTEFFAWYDDGDDVFEVGEVPIFGTSTQSAVEVFGSDTYALADSLFGPAFPANQTKHIGIAWCAGDLSVDLNLATVECDGTALGNEAQTDSFAVDLSLRAVPKKDNPKFTCKKPENTCHYPGPITIHLDNRNTSVTNNISANANTGGNSGGPSTGSGQGGTVVTGDASATVGVTNVVNTTNIEVGGSGGESSVQNTLRGLLRRR